MLFSYFNRYKKLGFIELTSFNERIYVLKNAFRDMYLNYVIYNQLKRDRAKRRKLYRDIRRTNPILLRIIKDL